MRASPADRDPAPVRLGVLASGRGSNLVALHEAIVRGDLPAEIAVVVSNNSSAGALAFARSRELPAVHVSTRTHADPGAALLDVFSRHAVDVVVLAGYMKLLDPRVVAAYRDHAVNIHPAPLPRFGGPGMYGARVHEAVLAAGVDTSGPTVHLVDEHYDGGEILAHRAVPVLPDDDVESLATRVLAAEHDVYWRAIAERFGARAGE
jgi:phosphoribosylglycinamide formyltransferase-1